MRTGRPPKNDRSTVAEITRSIRFTPIELRALDILAGWKSEELRGTGAKVSSGSLGQAIIRAETERTGAYAQAKKEFEAANPDQPRAPQLALNLGDKAPAKATDAPRAEPVSNLNATPKPASKVAPKPAPKVAPKPASKAPTKPASKAPTKPSAKPTSKAAPKSLAKPNGSKR